MYMIYIALAFQPYKLKIYKSLSYIGNNVIFKRDFGKLRCVSIKFNVCENMDF